MAAPADRLRERPRNRYGSRHRAFDLNQAYRDLPDESIARHGHMQKALYKHGSLTTAIFAFEAGSGLREHRVEGEAAIHILEGRVRVGAGEAEHELAAGEILLLDPTVPHDVQALEPTRLLMHVVLEGSRDA